MAYLTAADLEPFSPGIDPVKAEAMIDDAVAQAVLVAPCLANEDDLTDHQKAAVKAVLRAAILRWDDTGSGAFRQETVGPFTVSHDTRQGRRPLFWPSEINQLEALCRQVTGSVSGQAFSIDTAPGFGTYHRDICALHFGAVYCSCGADIAGRPIFEGGP